MRHSDLLSLVGKIKIAWDPYHMTTTYHCDCLGIYGLCISGLGCIDYIEPLFARQYFYDRHVRLVIKMDIICHATMLLWWWRHQLETAPLYWPFVRGIHWSPVNSSQKGQCRYVFSFSKVEASIRLLLWYSFSQAMNLFHSTFKSF